MVTAKRTASTQAATPRVVPVIFRNFRREIVSIYFCVRLFGNHRVKIGIQVLGRLVPFKVALHAVDDLLHAAHVVVERAAHVLQQAHQEVAPADQEAAQRAISSPLLEDGSIDGAQGVLINVTCGPDLALQEANEAANIVQKAVAEDAQIIWGTVIRPEQQEDIVISVIATGSEEKAHAAARPPVRVGRQAQAPVRENLDIPTHIRNQGLKKAVGMDFQVLESDLDSADLDIPTFLRRQAD